MVNIKVVDIGNCAGLYVDGSLRQVYQHRQETLIEGIRRVLQERQGEDSNMLWYSPYDLLSCEGLMINQLGFPYSFDDVGIKGGKQ